MTENDVKHVESVYWLYTSIFYVMFVIIMYCMLSFNIRHTYELPTDSPGVLISDRWSFSFIKEDNREIE